MALAGIELRYLVESISGQACDYYVSNIYGVTSDSILFKMHHPEKDDLFMMISTMGIWLTKVKIGQMEPNRLQRRLRSDLLRLKLRQVEQIGSERIAYFRFGGFGKELVLVVEFFGDGNILLCSQDMRILALHHSINVRHRRLGVGLDYLQPPQNGVDVFDMSRDDFLELETSEMRSVRWLGRTLGLPKKYAEGVFERAGVDPKKAGRDLAGGDIQRLYDAARGIVGDVVSGNHDPVIVRNGKAEVFPIRLGMPEGDVSDADTFMNGLDTAFTESLVNVGRTIQSSRSEKRLKELRTQVSEQARAIDTVMDRSRRITDVANSLYGMVAAGITSIAGEEAGIVLARYNARIVTEKGVALAVIGDEKIRINTDAPLQSIASVMFDEAKRQSGAVASIKKAMAKSEKSLRQLERETEEGMKAITVSEIRKKNWYERYRWFFTSDGLLAIGGRDAASNSAVVRKHLGKNDRVFHADIFGSPFFILKDAADAPNASMNEVAHATVCFSRAWREGMYGLSSYWVNPDQVKRSAPSGQFLPKGSFTIEGQRNFVKSGNLRLAVGVIQDAEDYVLVCGPVEPVRQRSICLAVIEPHGAEMVDTAKRIRAEFLKTNEDAVKKISIDDFVRVMPAGKSQIREAGR